MGRTRAASSDDIPIRDYVDALFAEVEKRNEQRFLAQKEAINAALASSDKAALIQEANAERWRQSANEWRGAMSDRDRELPSRREVEAATGSIDARLRRLEDESQASKGHAEGVNLSAGVLVSVITVAVIVISAVVAVANAVSG